MGMSSSATSRWRERVSRRTGNGECDGKQYVKPFPILSGITSPSCFMWKPGVARDATDGEYVPQGPAGSVNPHSGPSRSFGFFYAFQLHRIRSMLERTTHRLAGLDVESEGSKIVKGSRSESGLVNRDQTQGLLAARCREEFAILKRDVKHNSLFVFVLAHVGLQYLSVNFGRWYRTRPLEQFCHLGAFAIGCRCSDQRGGERFLLDAAALKGSPDDFSVAFP